MKKSGFVYVLSNPSFPGMIKIGRSMDPARRISTLGTGVPTPFELCYCVEVPDAVLIEREVHGELLRRRVTRSREFFTVDPTTARVVIDSVVERWYGVDSPFAQGWQAFACGAGFECPYWGDPQSSYQASSDWCDGYKAAELSLPSR